MKLIFIILISITTSFCIYAHSGRTDSKGGHHDRINGGYHFHHGNPPHQHIDGVCELTLRKKQKNTYSSSSSTSSKQNNWGLVLVGVIGIGAGYILKSSKNMQS